MNVNKRYLTIQARRLSTKDEIPPPLPPVVLGSGVKGLRGGEGRGILLSYLDSACRRLFF
jgi:hypothetical protein